MTLYDVLISSSDLSGVALLWVRETYLTERVRLGGRVAELLYKAAVLDISRSFVGSIEWAIEFSIFQDCWDGMYSAMTEKDGVLRGYFLTRLPPGDLPEDEAPADLHDFDPKAIFSLELVGVSSGGSLMWGGASV